MKCLSFNNAVKLLFSGDYYLRLDYPGYYLVRKNNFGFREFYLRRKTFLRLASRFPFSLVGRFRDYSYFEVLW